MLDVKAEIDIRRASTEDAAEIASVLYRSFVEYETVYTSEAFIATTPGPERIKERLQEGPTWVAADGGNIVGTVSAVLRNGELYIRSMAILPFVRGQGVGNLLLNQVENFARDTNCSRLSLSTTPFLIRATRLYEHFGFERSGEGPHDLFGTPLFTMSKKLN